MLVPEKSLPETFPSKLQWGHIWSSRDGAGKRNHILSQLITLIRNCWNTNRVKEVIFAPQWLLPCSPTASDLLWLFPLKLSACAPDFSSVWTCVMKQNNKQVTSSGGLSPLWEAPLKWPGLCSRSTASGSLVSSNLVVHFLSLCHCCSPLQQIQSGSAYTNMECSPCHPAHPHRATSDRKIPGIKWPMCRTASGSNQ